MLEEMEKTARMIKDLGKIGVIGVYDGFYNGTVKFQVDYTWFKENINDNYFSRNRESKEMPYELVYVSEYYEIIAVLNIVEYEDFKTWEGVK